jgi:hypothetical protein
MVDVQELRKFLSDYAEVHCEESTKREYLQVFDKIAREDPQVLVGIESPASQGIDAYLADLKRRGYGESLVRFRYFFLKTLCENVMRGAWPMRSKDIPPEPEIFRQPVLELPHIQDMILKMRVCSDSAALTRFAIATIYGPRRVELMQLDDRSISSDLGKIQIKTRKHGDIRTHLIPNEIKPYLTPSSLMPLSEWKLSELFKRIEWFCGYRHVGWFGWHSIRRRLITYFDDIDVAENKIFTFMRWKRRKTILDRYKVRKPEETIRKLTDVDSMIFKVHPLLAWWATLQGQEGESSTSPASATPEVPPQPTPLVPSQSPQSLGSQ